MEPLKEKMEHTVVHNLEMAESMGVLAVLKDIHLDSYKKEQWQKKLAEKAEKRKIIAAKQASRR